MVTLYRLRPMGRTRAATIAGIAEDLALMLCTEAVFVQAIPSEGVIGVYVPHQNPKPLMWRDLVASATVQPHNAEVPLVLGSDWLGRVFIDDLTTLPHLMGAGSTGSGKSVWLRSIIASLRIVQGVNNIPIRLVISDTKNVEFTDFIGDPSLYFGERATSIQQTSEQMEKLRDETDLRLGALAVRGVRNIKEYNAGQGKEDKLPYIVMAIDELADVAEDTGAMDHLDYLARKARAAGIHLIANTQRPSADVIKGLVKNNFLGRVCFRMPDGINSRIVLGETGAENLMKQGDMLYSSPNFPGLLRLHSGYATSNDIKGMLEAAVYKYLGIHGN